MSRTSQGFWRYLRESPGTPAWVFPLTAAVLFFILSAACVAVLQGSARQWDAVWAYRLTFWNGWLTTIRISIAALALSTLFGVVAALASQSRWIPLKAFARLYVEIIRGTPLIVQILILYYAVFHTVGLENRYTAGILILSIFSGAYICEIVRAGIEGVGASQWESARAIGLTPAQTYRYIVFPQALRGALPPMAGQFASIIKDSSLLMIIGLPEFTLSAQQVNSATYSTLESYLPLAIGYLVLTLPISFASRVLERHLHYET